MVKGNQVAGTHTLSIEEEEEEENEENEEENEGHEGGRRGFKEDRGKGKGGSGTS